MTLLKMDKDAISKQAKKIMDDFMKELAKVPELKDYGVERKESLRKAKDVPKDKDFREDVLDNAPKVKDDCIQAEKKTW